MRAVQVDEEMLRGLRTPAEFLPDDLHDKRGTVVGWPQTASPDPHPQRPQFDE
jgi:hypothetical protein